MGRLTKDQLNHFSEFGFLKVENLIDPEKIIDPIIEEYHTVLGNLADELYAEGKISSKYEDLEFGERVTKIYAESGEVYNQYFDFSLPQSGIKKDTPFWAGPAVFNALRCESLLDAVESIIGDEIFSNPIQHVRIKVPEAEAPRDENGMVKFGATPWHQDAGVATEEVDNTNMLTVWFPLMDASEENGCLQVVPGSHEGKVLTHCPGFNPKTGKLIDIPYKKIKINKLPKPPKGTKIDNIDIARKKSRNFEIKTNKIKLNKVIKINLKLIQQREHFRLLEYMSMMS